MLDMNSSELVLEAQLADRRRELSALARKTPRATRHRHSFSASIAGTLAHLAFHINRQAVGDVTAHHPHTAYRS